MSGKRHLPNWIYAPLPFVYIGFGGIAAYNSSNVWGLISGLMLFSVGALVWWWRYSYRLTMRQTFARLPDGGKRPPRRHPGLVNLTWSPEYECGNDVIDGQHRNLFALVNEIMNAVLENKPKGDIELQLDDLVDQVADHFCTEEALLARTGYPLSTSHREAHRHLLELCKTMNQRFRKGELNIGDLFQFVALNVVSEHLINEDLKPAQALAE